MAAVAVRNPLERQVHKLRALPRRFVITVSVIIMVLIALRVALPFVLESAINRRLTRIPEYTGHVGDINLHLWRGAYSIDGLVVSKLNDQAAEPFVAAKRIDFSIAWRDLFRGKLVSDIEVEDAQLTFIRASTETAEQLPADKRWQEVIEDLFPIEITQLTVHGGILRFVDTESVPHVDIAVRDLQVLATGLRNRPAKEGEIFPAQITVEGETVGDGKVRLFVQLEPLAPQPHFDLNLELQNVALPALNDFLRAYGNVDVSRGVFRLFIEVGGRDGRFEGYVKPFFEDLEFQNLEDQNKNFGQRVWENIVSVLATLLKNKSRDQLGTRIPISGEFGDTQVGVWATIVNLLRHGFVRALRQGLEGDVFGGPGEGGQAPTRGGERDRVLEPGATEKTKNSDARSPAPQR